jgi:hypothetical protein
MLFQLYAPDLAEPNFDVHLNEKEVESRDGAVEHPDDELMANSVEKVKDRGRRPEWGVEREANQILLQEPVYVSSSTPKAKTL